MLRGIGEPGREIAAGHELADQIRLVLLIADVEHGNDVRMITQAAHGASFAPHTLAPGIVFPVLRMMADLRKP